MLALLVVDHACVAHASAGNQSGRDAATTIATSNPYSASIPTQYHSRTVFSSHPPNKTSELSKHLTNVVKATPIAKY